MAEVFAGVRTKEQLECVLVDDRVDAVILQAGCFSDASELSGYEKDFYYALPAVARENKRILLEKTIKLFLEAGGGQRGFLIENMDEAALLKEAGFQGPVIAGEFCYAYNSAAVSFYRQLFPSMEFLAPAELTLKELEKVENNSKISFIYKAYGHQRLMATAQCLYKDHKGCLKEKTRKNGREQDGKDGNPGIFAFTDRKQERFYAAADCTFCMDAIYNGKPTFMLDKKEELTEKKILLDFTIESADEVKGILEMAWGQKPQTLPAAQFTRGHYYKKID